MLIHFLNCAKSFEMPNIRIYYNIGWLHSLRQFRQGGIIYLENLIRQSAANLVGNCV